MRWLCQTAGFCEFHRSRCLPLVKAVADELHIAVMLRLIPLLLALCLVSCLHTAVAPLLSPAGEPIAIRVPGVAKGEKAKLSQLMAIDEKLLAGVTSETLVWKYFPELEGKGSPKAQLFGIVGEVKTKRGESIYAYIPAVAVQAPAPASRVEEAAGKLATDLYQRAKKTCEIYPASQIAKLPKKP